MRALAALAALLALTAAAWLGHAPAVEAKGHGMPANCPDLIAVIDRALHAPIIIEPDFSGRLGSHDFDPDMPKAANVRMDLVLSCWRRRGGAEPVRAVGASTRAAVLRVSARAMAVRAYDLDHGLSGFGYFMPDALRLERTMGVDGPVTRLLREKGLAAITPERSALPPVFSLSLRSPFDGTDLMDRVAILDALCLADPAGFKADVAILDIHAAQLAWRPAVIPGDDADWYAYIGAETARILKDCPL